MKIKLDCERIIDEIALIEPKIMIIIMESLYPDDNVQDFDIEDADNSQNTANSTARSIMFRGKGLDYKNYLKIAIRRNREVVGKDISYHKTYEEIEELIKERAKLKGMREDNFYYLVLFKFFSEHIFKGEIIEKLKEKCTEMAKVALEYTERINKEIKKGNMILSLDLMGTKSEALFNDLVYEYVSGRGKYEFFDADALEDRYKCKYDEKKKEFNNVKRGILFFLYLRADYLERSHIYYKEMTDYLSREADELKEEKELTLFARKQYPVMLKQINNLKAANKALKKEDKRLNSQVLKKIDKSSHTELEGKVHQLQKQNNYNLSRIEKLEEQIAVFEEEKKLNKELTENIQLEEIPKPAKPNLPEYRNIVVMGGRWTSNNRKDVKKYLATNDIEFIEADKTLRNFDKIANADTIFYDTTYNSHSYYYKAKKCHAEFYHINKSNLLEFKKIFEG
jgi:hypothetical protein